LKIMYMYVERLLVLGYYKQPSLVEL
jgi:hypothetical protein